MEKINVCSAASDSIFRVIQDDIKQFSKPIELMHSVASRICVFVFDNVPFDGHFV